jgi:hypothetical protein
VSNLLLCEGEPAMRKLVLVKSLRLANSPGISLVRFLHREKVLAAGAGLQLQRCSLRQFCHSHDWASCDGRSRMRAL